MEKIDGLEVVVEFQIGTENWGQFRLSPHLSSPHLSLSPHLSQPLATAAKGVNIWNYGVSAVSALICGIGR
jgi:hypothetical protein